MDASVIAAISGRFAAVLLAAPSDAPIDIGRDEARDLAQQELAKKVYVDAQPSWWERASTWAWDQFNELLHKAGSAAGGVGWLLVLIMVVVAIGVLIAVRTGRIERRRKAGSTVVFGEELMSAAQHRAQAELAAREGRWTDAVMEAFRAVVRQLEERGALDRRPGRTADEAAREAGRQFPDHAAALLAAARAFDEVAYSDRAGTSGGYGQIRDVDQALRSSRLLNVT